MLKTTRYFVCALTAAAALGVPSASYAADAAVFPDKPVTLVVSFPPGGATDAVARVLGAELSMLWGQSVLVENKTGAGGNIGANHVAKSKPDGYTLLLGSPAETVINALLYPEMPYDAEKDLLAVTKAGSAPLLLVSHPSVPVKSVPDLINYVKQNAGKVAYASSGTGGPQHLAGEEFKRITGLEITHIPYRGGAPAMTDLVGGQVQMFFAGLPPALPFVKADKVTALGVTTKERSVLAEGIPSLHEQGVEGFDIENWQGVFAPAGTDPDVVKKIAEGIATALNKPQVQRSLAAKGVSAAPTTPKEFQSFIEKERAKYSAIIKAANVTVK